MAMAVATSCNIIAIPVAKRRPVASLRLNNLLFTSRQSLLNHLNPITILTTARCQHGKFTPKNCTFLIIIDIYKLVYSTLDWILSNFLDFFTVVLGYGGRLVLKEVILFCS